MNLQNDIADKSTFGWREKTRKEFFNYHDKKKEVQVSATQVSYKV